MSHVQGCVPWAVWWKPNKILTNNVSKKRGRRERNAAGSLFTPTVSGPVKALTLQCGAVSHRQISASSARRSPPPWSFLIEQNSFSLPSFLGHKTGKDGDIHLTFNRSQRVFVNERRKCDCVTWVQMMSSSSVWTLLTPFHTVGVSKSGEESLSGKRTGGWKTIKLVILFWSGLSQIPGNGAPQLGAEITDVYFSFIKRNQRQPVHDCMEVPHSSGSKLFPALLSSSLICSFFSKSKIMLALWPSHLCSKEEDGGKGEEGCGPSLSRLPRIN